MQTPAPFEYERATSVEGAIASLVKHDGEARIIAGGHSLLPMMKLRLAPRAPDRHQRSRGARPTSARTATRSGSGRSRATSTSRVGAARRAPAGVPRRRAGDRRPGRAQPRHDRRVAVPGRCRRGPERGLLGAQGEGRDPGPGRRAGGRDGRVLHRPVHDRGRRRRAPDRDPAPARARTAAAPTRRSSGGPATSRSRPLRRRSGSTAARSPTPASRSARSARPRSM